MATREQRRAVVRIVRVMRRILQVLIHIVGSGGGIVLGRCGCVIGARGFTTGRRCPGVRVVLLLLLRGARLAVGSRARLIITFALLNLRRASVVAAVVLMRRRRRPVMMAQHHRRLNVARAAGRRAQRVLMMHKRAHNRRVRNGRLVLAAAVAQAQVPAAVVVVVVVRGRCAVVVVVGAGRRAGGNTVGRCVLGWRRWKGEQVMTARATVTRQTAGGGRQRGA